MPAIVQPSLFAINAVWCSAMSGNTQKSQRMPSLTSHGTEFKDMFVTACQYPKTPHFMAILKRTIVIIAGHHAAYVHMPSEHETEPILRFSYGGITKDWLRQKNKGVFGLFKQGLQTVLRSWLLAFSRRREKKVHPSSWLPRPLACHRRTFFTGSVRPTLWLSRSKKNFRLQRRRRSLALILVSSMWRCMEDIEDPAATLAPVPEEPGERMASLRWYLISFPDDADVMNHGFSLNE